MKLYDYQRAPSPRRVRIFLAEKGITVPTVQVDLGAREQNSEAFRAINPDCTVPVLELDDGTRITDAIGICVYVEALQPEPPLMGTDARSKGLVTAWQRWAERDGFYAMMEAFRNSSSGMKDRGIPGPVSYPQIPELAARGRGRLATFFARLDKRLGESRYVAGDRYTIADITALVTVDWTSWIKLGIPDDAAHIRRWHAEVSARPSATA